MSFTPSDQGSTAAGGSSAEVLVDSSPLAYASVRGTFSRLGSAYAFSRDLTTADDGKMMSMEIRFSRNDRGTDSSSAFQVLNIPARSWRLAPVIANSTSTFIGWDILLTNFFTSRDTPVTVVLAKGTDGRLGMRTESSPGSGRVRIAQLRVTLLG